MFMNDNGVLADLNTIHHLLLSLVSSSCQTSGSSSS